MEPIGYYFLQNIQEKDLHILFDKTFCGRKFIFIPDYMGLEPFSGLWYRAIDDAMYRIFGEKNYDDNFDFRSYFPHVAVRPKLDELLKMSEKEALSLLHIDR